MAEIAGTGVPPVMLLACPELRVVPVTIHEPLKQAIARLTPALIIECARLTAAGAAAGFRHRRAAAGHRRAQPACRRGRHLGTEDRDIVAPAVAALRAEGIDARGPIPPDTMFTAKARPGYDVALGLYHDQALIPIKTLDMTGGVNVTLGLSIVRTSPDHGTALDIAGKGLADPGSLIAAIRLAAEIAAHRQNATDDRSAEWREGLNRLALAGTTPMRLSVNIDHVATLRNARGGSFPCPVEAARIAMAAGADGITMHLREDRRHVRDQDLHRVAAEVAGPAELRDGGDRGDGRHRHPPPPAGLLPGAGEARRN